MDRIENGALLFQESGGTATITINRPEKMNALSREVVAGLHDVLGIIDGNRDIRVVVIKGAGGKAFIAGADIEEFTEMDSFMFREYYKSIMKAGERISSLSQPVIAAVDGFALGGGCSIMLSCDLIVATDRSRFGILETNLGFVANGSSLVRLVGRHIASELTMLAPVIDVQQAYRLHMVNRVVEPQALDKTVEEICRNIEGRAPYAMALTKQSIRSALDGGLTNGIGYEIEAAAFCFQAEESRTAIRKFVEKTRLK